MTTSKTKGCVSRFIGEKGEFLDAMAGEFMSSRDRGSFYSLAATRYVHKFGYSVYGPSPELSTMDPANKAAELERRKKFLPWLRTTLGNWFRHKYGGHQTDQSTLNKILLAMKDVSQHRPSRPKLLHRYSQVHYKDRIKPSFDLFWMSQGGTVPKAQRLAMTQDFVQKAWALETSEFQAEFKQRVEAEFQDALRAYNTRLDYGKSTAQAKADAWHSIDSVVPNLADALGEWVGGSIHIDIVAPLGLDDGRIHVKSVQSKVVSKDNGDEDLPEGQSRLLFAEWDPDADREHKANLVKYGAAIFSEEERQNRVLSEESEPDSHESSELDNGQAVQTSVFTLTPSFPSTTSPSATHNARNHVVTQVRNEPLASAAAPTMHTSRSKRSSGSTPIESSTQSIVAGDPAQVYTGSDVKAGSKGLYQFCRDDQNIIQIAKQAIALGGESHALFGPPLNASTIDSHPQAASLYPRDGPTTTARLLYSMLESPPSTRGVSAPTAPFSSTEDTPNITTSSSLTGDTRNMTSPPSTPGRQSMDVEEPTRLSLSLPPSIGSSPLPQSTPIANSLHILAQTASATLDSPQRSPWSPVQTPIIPPPVLHVPTQPVAAARPASTPSQVPVEPELPLSPLAIRHAPNAPPLLEEHLPQGSPAPTGRRSPRKVAMASEPPQATSTRVRTKSNRFQEMEASEAELEALDSVVPPPSPQNAMKRKRKASPDEQAVDPMPSKTSGRVRTKTTKLLQIMEDEKTTKAAKQRARAGGAKKAESAESSPTKRPSKKSRQG